MSEHDSLIRRLRAKARVFNRGIENPGVWFLLTEAADALEARPSLVAEAREALIGAITHGDGWATEEREGIPLWVAEEAADRLLAPGGPVRLADAIRAEVIDWIADGDSTPSIRRSVKNARGHFGIDVFTRREQTNGE